MKVFNFWSKFLNFKGVCPRNKCQNFKKSSILNFNGMMKRGHNNFFSIEASRKKLSGGEIFNFGRNFSNFKGVSPRNESRNSRKIKIFNFNGMMKRGNNYFFSV